MRARSVLAGTLVLLLLPFFSSAQSLAELQAQIQALLQQVSTLESQLGIQSVPPTSTATNPAVASCVSLNRILSFGISGSDVSALQGFLMAQGDLAAGNASGYFGALTQTALQRFQARSGIVSSGSAETTGYGATGPRTRGLILSVSCGNSVRPITATPPSATGIPCIVGNLGVAHGASVTLYERPTTAGALCRAQARQCINGVLTGNPQFQFTSCSISNVPNISTNDPDDETTGERCRLDSVNVQHGESRIFYSVRTVDFGDSCSDVAEERECEDGVLDGPSRYKFRSCRVDTPSCSLDGLTINVESSTTFYFAKNIPANEKCSSYAQTRSCTSNEKLSGNDAYKYSNCGPVTTSQCALDNTVLDSGSSASFYRHRTAPAGELCSAHILTRTCTTGSLSGSNDYIYASCSNETKCTLDGLTLEHGSSTAFYKERTVAFGTTCSSIGLTRTCTNAKLSGSDDYKYGSCNVNPPTAAAAQYLANALSAIESALQAILGKLAE